MPRLKREGGVNGDALETLGEPQSLHNPSQGNHTQGSDTIKNVSSGFTLVIPTWCDNREAT